MPHAELNRALADYRDAFAEGWRDDAATTDVRFVALDCETTGLDTQRHRIVSIGAIALREAQIDLGDCFEALLRVRFNTASTLVHGITRTETRDGLTEPEALTGLLDYLGDGVIVGHHIGYDIAMIDAALARHAGDGGRLLNRRLDTAGLTRRLAVDGAFADPPLPQEQSLDALCAYFGIVPYDRHTAPGDAFLTAQVLLRLLRIAARCGRDRLGALLEPPPAS